ncbi:MAG: DUF4149 domain-containing protein [Gemmataceae bacterium]
MIVTRRFLALFALMFWLGGLMVFGAIVVPVIRANLDGPVRNTITQTVTRWMNFAGTVALLLTFVEAWAASARRWRWAAWVGMALPQIAVVWLHHELSRQMKDGLEHTNKAGFLAWHGAYMAFNVMQVLAGLTFAFLALRTWRKEDASAQDAI